MDILTAILGAIPSKDVIGFLLALVLIVVIDRRLFVLVQSVARIEEKTTSAMAHQTSRMEEIRRDIQNISRFMGILTGQHKP